MAGDNPFEFIVQPPQNSPYSRFGLGDQVIQEHSFLYHMGGLSAAFHDKFNTNVVNPASLPYLKATSFETGLNARNSTLSEGDDSFTSWSGALSYFSLAFPLSNPINDLLDRVERKYELGMAFTVQPFSTVAYDIFTIEDSNGVEGVQRNYIGTGGTYSAQWGTGIKVKDFSAGINVGFLFGKTSTIRTVTFTELDNAYANFERLNSNLTGFIWNLGVQYDIDLNKAARVEDDTKPTKILTIGAYGNPGTNFSTTTDEEFLLVRSGQDIQAEVDTIFIESGVEGKGRLPAKFGIGFMLNNKLLTGEDKWGFGVNYETQLWSQYENDAAPTDVTLINSSRVSMGGFFRPDPKSLTNYLKRIYYQAGVFYATDPAQVQNQTIAQYGATFGIGMPYITARKVSNANIGATVGTRGLNTAIEERYIQLNFGFTFNSNEWFIKRKYN